jgi:uncharacterized protein (TIGR02145 family)
MDSLPTVPSDISAFNNDAGYLTNYTENQSLADVTAIGNSAGSRQLKDVSDPTEAYDAVNLRTLTLLMDSLRNNFQQQLQQLQQQMQQQIDSLQEIVNALDTNHHTDYFVCGTSTLTDYDGNVYSTVQIGDQCWMRENLRVTRYENGDMIPNYGYSSIFPCRYAPNNDDNQVHVYGYLYNWPAAMGGASSSNAVPSGVQGICPDGWHLPSQEEWHLFWSYMDAQFRYACYIDELHYFAKSMSSTAGWDATSYPCSPGNDQSLNNASGFNAYPAGYCYYGTPIAFGYNTFFWSSTENNFYGLVCGRPDPFWVIHEDPTCGYSVRCVKD